MHSGKGVVLYAPSEESLGFLELLAESNSDKSKQITSKNGINWLVDGVKCSITLMCILQIPDRHKFTADIKRTLWFIFAAKWV